jgi:hypothetical protein
MTRVVAEKTRVPADAPENTLRLSSSIVTN